MVYSEKRNRICVEKVSIQPSTITVQVGTWYTGACAQVCPTNAANQAVTWYSSSDPCVASVSGSTGKIYAKSAGTTTITATTTDGNLQACCTVTATVPDTDIPKPRSRFGSVVYQGEEHNIFVPNHLETTIDAVWEEVDRKIVSDLKFDWFSFIAGTEFHDQEGGIVVPGDFKGELKRSILCDSDMKPVIGVAGILAGILDAVSESMNRIFIEFIFKKTSDNHKRVIIRAGSSDIKQVFTQLADGIPMSAYYSNAGSPLAQAAVRHTCEDFYTEITGKKVGDLEMGDCEITLDSQHRYDGGAASYLWINIDGEITETPIIYPKDKVCFGVKGLSIFSPLEPFYSVPLGGSTIAAPEYQALFNLLQ